MTVLPVAASAVNNNLFLCRRMSSILLTSLASTFSPAPFHTAPTTFSPAPQLEDDDLVFAASAVSGQ